MAGAERATVLEVAESMDVGGILVRRWLGCWLDLIALAIILFGPAVALAAYLPPNDQAVSYALVGMEGYACSISR